MNGRRLFPTLWPRGAFLLAALLLGGLVAGCASRHEPGDDACPAQTWKDVAEIVRCEPAPPSGGANLGGPEVRPYVVEFRIVGEAAPENSAVRRRTTPFLMTLGAGGLPDEAYVRSHGLALGAKLPVTITEGFPEDRWTFCGGVQIQFEDLH
ncbi:MAG: hypothetical protein AB7E32_15640 [Desulfovibrio sp.]